MKTVSTKLDNRLHNRFIEICNLDGRCQSEMLRDIIETMCEDLEEETTPIETQTTSVLEPTITIVDV
jgi:predicted DNA-binding protein